MEPIDTSRSPTRRVGGLDVRVPDQFFDALPEDEIALWEGGLDTDELTPPS